ncbi:MAG: hypothetical protein ACRELB_21575, partial [Polyangiaceae bacterium]
MKISTAILALAGLGVAAVAACSSSSGGNGGTADAGTDSASSSGSGSSGSSSGTSSSSGSSSGGTCNLASFTAPPDPGAGSIWFAASGEVLALTGYPFPPVNDGDPAFVDGWDVKFTRLLVTVDKIKISSSPDTNPGDQSQTGPLVGEVDGPWAIDLSHSDPNYLAGKGGPGEEAAPIAVLTNQNKNGNQPFATDGTRYAFGFDTVAATCSAQNVNLDAAGLADYAEMVQNGCAVFYVGTATFKGGTVPGYTTCNDDPEYANWPKTVNFRFCYKSPTTYANCQNPDNDPAQPFANEEHQRGIALSATTSTVGQVTIHTDHPFWDSVLHDPPAHFDQFAARVVGQDAGTTPTVTVEMTKGVDYTAYTDALGNKLNWRYCMAPATDVHPQFNGQMAFDPQSVPHCTGGDHSTGLCDYYDYTTYDQSTQGHLNSDGLC